VTRSERCHIVLVHGPNRVTGAVPGPGRTVTGTVAASQRGWHWQARAGGGLGARFGTAGVTVTLGP
jgi:hypothetical protein